MRKLLMAFLAVCIMVPSMNLANAAEQNKVIYPGAVWFDNNRNLVNAHGGAIIKEDGKYYFFGEYRDSSNSFNGVGCYSSEDLVNWNFEGVVMTKEESGDLGPNRIGERPKVVKCPTTGEYILFIHIANSSYKERSIAYATSKKLTGPYTYKGSILNAQGEVVPQGDFTVYKDTDGTGYIFGDEGNVFKLAPDYKSWTEHVVKNGLRGSESPAIFKKDGTYFWIFSHKTGYRSNDNEYATASSIRGPWTVQKLIAPKGVQTYNSQSTAVLPVQGTEGTTYMYLGDRWSAPLQNAATYVWQPIIVEGNEIRLPAPMETGWKIDVKKGTWSSVKEKGLSVTATNFGTGLNVFDYQGTWDYDGTRSLASIADSTASITFTGTQIKLFGTADPNFGYGAVSLLDDKGNVVLPEAALDFYGPSAANDVLKWVSPILKKGTYTLKVRVLGSKNKYAKTTTIGLERVVISAK